MRIHTDHAVDVMREAQDAALLLPGVRVECLEFGSRRRISSFELRVTGEPGNGRRPANTMGPNSPGRRGVYSATWDEWGVVLNRVFTIDPEADMPGHYEGREHFRWATGNRFDAVPEPMHGNHRWNYDGGVATKTYSVFSCRGTKGKPCSAVQRRLLGKRTFDSLQG